MAKKSNNHHLEKRGDNWSFVTMVNGKRVKKALSTSITEARRLRDQYLKEITVYGEIVSLKPALESGDNEILFGEVAEKWAKITSKQVKSSTWKDYKGAMNYYLLPYFGDTPIDQVTYLMVEEFVSELPCSSKRANNVLVPLRSLMRFAYRAELIPKNPMDLVDNQKTDKADIDPLSMDEVNRFLDVIDPFYKPFFIVAFFTGMRFGEMSGLKWKNVSFEKKIIQVKVTRVRGEEGHPKTNGSVRDIKMLPPVVEALKEQHRTTANKAEYVFLNKNDRPVLPASINFLFWKPALEKAGLKPRSLYHTRHTFATLMLDSGEVPGWVQKMMGHSSLKMILERYYSHIKNYERDDGTAFMERVYLPTMKNTISS